MRVCLAAPLTNHNLLCTGGIKNLDNEKKCSLMKRFLAGENYKKNLLDKINLTDNSSLKEINILESFYYLRKNKEFMPIIPYLGTFLLDSGAFTFIQGSSKEACDWDRYVEEYANFINQYDINLFFELDIDKIVGLSKVEKLREKLEFLTKKKPIPVWHLNQGKEYFVDMCKEYPYVALGGIAIKEIPLKIYKNVFPWFIDIAHRYKAKIHGLGYTVVSDLKRYHFDSVDSTAWLYGNRGGYIYKFNPDTGLMEQISKAGCRLKTKEAAAHNLNEWIKFSKYADKFL